jgi:hypothetical protein
LRPERGRHKDKNEETKNAAQAAHVLFLGGKVGDLKD